MTLEMDAASQERFERLRQTHYPRELNRIAAHLTLFHTLPDSDEVRDALAEEAGAVSGFALQVKGVRSLARGTAYFLESEALMQLHGRLAARFRQHLSAQDRQGFRPHVVVQNKVSGEEAQALTAALKTEFEPWEAEAMGLCWWDYLGGPWDLRERFGFAA